MDIKTYLAKVGRKGGIASAKSKTRKQRVAQAKKAAKARWAHLKK